jgi:hypothetical protein
MKERGYPILNSARHLRKIAKYLKDSDKSRDPGKSVSDRCQKFQYRSVWQRSAMLDHGYRMEYYKRFARRDLAFSKCGASERNGPDVRQELQATLLQL